MLSTTHKRIFEFIKGSLVVDNEAPTIMEICKAFGLSVGGVHGMLKRLEREGLIKRTPNIARGITLSDSELMIAGREG